MCWSLLVVAKLYCVNLTERQARETFKQALEAECISECLNSQAKHSAQLLRTMFDSVCHIDVSSGSLWVLWASQSFNEMAGCHMPSKSIFYLIPIEERVSFNSFVQSVVAKGGARVISACS